MEINKLLQAKHEVCTKATKKQTVPKQDYDEACQIINQLRPKLLSCLYGKKQLQNQITGLEIEMQSQKSIYEDLLNEKEKRIKTLVQENLKIKQTLFKLEKLLSICQSQNPTVPRPDQMY